jgi:hydroxymethylpyrimidine pyrophosphatase-like HAD family hydrolase
MTASIEWNEALKLGVSDVDETIAEVYIPAEPEMVAELSSLLASGHKLFMVTGGSLSRVRTGITDLIEPRLRHDILVGHCSGAEVWGFTDTGELRDKPFYSIYEETFTPELKRLWREKTQELVAEFGLRLHPIQPKAEFKKLYQDPLDIMYDDRGPQITLVLVNATNLTDEQATNLPHEIPVAHDGSRDLRLPIVKRAEELYAEARIPITPRIAGSTAIDLAVKGVSKATSIERVLSSPDVLQTIGLSANDLHDVSALEVWGDRFSSIRGGTDRHISEALPPQVRSIDFREENPAEFEEGYNIVVWDGEQHLHHGLLEYLKSRPRA